jgi:hypothetical protein
MSSRPHYRFRSVSPVHTETLEYADTLRKKKYSSDLLVWEIDAPAMFVAFPASGIFKTNFEVKKSWQNVRQNQPNLRKTPLGVNRRRLCGQTRRWNCYWGLLAITKLQKPRRAWPWTGRIQNLLDLWYFVFERCRRYFVLESAIFLSRDVLLLW